jgi:hypothetical protein
MLSDVLANVKLKELLVILIFLMILFLQATKTSSKNLSRFLPPNLALLDGQYSLFYPFTEGYWLYVTDHSPLWLDTKN